MKNIEETVDKAATVLATNMKYDNVNKDTTDMERWKEEIEKVEKEMMLREEEINLAAETIAKVAYYNITGDGEEPSAFESHLAKKELEKMIEALDKM